jgi:hypothetical protein
LIKIDPDHKQSPDGAARQAALVVQLQGAARNPAADGDSLPIGAACGPRTIEVADSPALITVQRATGFEVQSIDSIPFAFHHSDPEMADASTSRTLSEVMYLVQALRKITMNKLLRSPAFCAAQLSRSFGDGIPCLDQPDWTPSR